jgi:hypothetical protein
MEPSDSGVGGGCCVAGGAIHSILQMMNIDKAYLNLLIYLLGFYRFISLSYIDLYIINKYLLICISSGLVQYYGYLFGV